MQEFSDDLKFHVFNPEVWNMLGFEIIFQQKIEFLIEVILYFITFSTINMMVAFFNSIISHDVAFCFYFPKDFLFNNCLKIFIIVTPSSFRWSLSTIFG